MLPLTHARFAAAAVVVVGVLCCAHGPVLAATPKAGTSAELIAERCGDDSACVATLTANAASCPYAFPTATEAQDTWPCIHEHCLGGVDSPACVALVASYCDAQGWTDTACTHTYLQCAGLFSNAENSPCVSAACTTGTWSECAAQIDTFCGATANATFVYQACAPAWAGENAYLQHVGAGACPFPFPADDDLVDLWPCTLAACADVQSRACAVASHLYCTALGDWESDPGCAGGMRVECLFQPPSYPASSDTTLPENPCEAEACVGAANTAGACADVVDTYCAFYGRADAACVGLIPHNDSTCLFGQPTAEHIALWPCTAIECADDDAMTSPDCRYLITQFCELPDHSDDPGCRSLQVECGFLGDSSAPSPCEALSCEVGDVEGCAAVVDTYCTARPDDPHCDSAVDDQDLACWFWPQDASGSQAHWPCVDSTCGDDYNNPSCVDTIVQYCSEGSGDSARYMAYAPCNGAGDDPLVAPCPFGDADDVEGICNTGEDGYNFFCDPEDERFNAEVCHALVAAYCDNNYNDLACCTFGKPVRVSFARGALSAALFGSLSLPVTLSSPDLPQWAGASWELSPSQPSSPALCLVEGARYDVVVGGSFRQDRLVVWLNADDGERFELHTMEGVGSTVPVGIGGTGEGQGRLRFFIPDVDAMVANVSVVYPSASVSSSPSISQSPSPTSSQSLTATASISRSVTATPSPSRTPSPTITPPYQGTSCLGTYEPCMNGGRCFSIRGGFNCQCPSLDGTVFFYSGDLCEQKNPCYPNPCRNGGTCSSGTCQCGAGYTGEFCEEVDACALSQPCTLRDSGAQCTPDGTSYTCSCSDNFVGDHCDLEIVSVTGVIVLDNVDGSTLSADDLESIRVSLAVILGVPTSEITIQLLNSKQSSASVQFQIQNAAQSTVSTTLSASTDTLVTRLVNDGFPNTLGVGIDSVEQDFLDCEGTLNGDARADGCKVCGGDNACVDCAGTPNGTATADLCGVCNGNSSSCADCFGIPNGSGERDECGVCEGDGSSCASSTASPSFSPSTSLSPSEPAPESDKDSGPDSAMIAGIAVGATGALVGAALCVTMAMKRRTPKPSGNREEPKALALQVPREDEGVSGL